MKPSTSQTCCRYVAKPLDDRRLRRPARFATAACAAAYLQVHLNKAMQSKGIAACSMVMCPGAVDTEIIPPIFKPFQGLLAQARYVLLARALGACSLGEHGTLAMWHLAHLGGHACRKLGSWRTSCISTCTCNSLLPMHHHAPPRTEHGCQDSM